MALNMLVTEHTAAFSIAVVSVAVFGSIFIYLFHPRSFSQKAPKLASESWPIIGSIQFFTERWSFFERQVALSHTGNFSFYAGDKPVVGISGDHARKLFFESKTMSLSDGYAALLGGTPRVNRKNNPMNSESVDREDGFTYYFNQRIAAVVKGPVLARALPKLIDDIRGGLDKLTGKQDHITNPFDSIYRTVYQLTMRITACDELASDQALLDKTLKMFETIGNTATPLSIMYSWMPVLAKFRRLYAGVQLYTIIKSVVDTRRKEGRSEDDALQFLIDHGDDIFKITTVVVGALFAGQVNSGVNAAWILLYLANNKMWCQHVRDELDTVADRHCPDKSLPIRDRLTHVPYEAWESEFPTIDLCLKDCIRLQVSSACFRKNISGRDIPLNKTEVIPPNAYVAYHAREIHHDPTVYENPLEWDPARYLPDRAEDKKKEYAWLGWGVARHPCIGIKFAKLEITMIVAFFLAYFEELQVVQENGEPRGLPAVNKNSHQVQKPDEQVFLKYQPRQD